MAQNIPLKSSAVTNIQKKIYIPDGCAFEVVGTISGSPTIITTKDPHCLSDNDDAVMCLKKVDGCTVISYEQKFTVTRISDTSFSIPYDSSDCNYSLVGHGHKPKDLTGYTYTTVLQRWGLTEISGNDAQFTAGESVVSVPIAPSNNRLSPGGTLRMGDFSATITGATPSQGECCESRLFLSLDSVVTSSASTSWIATIPRTKQGNAIDVDQLPILVDVAQGSILVDIPQSSIDENYFYRYSIIESVAGATAETFYGDITIDHADEGCGGVASCVVPQAVVVADPAAIANIPVAVTTRTALASLGSGLTDYTVRQPLGIDNPGDVDLPFYWLVPSTNTPDGVIEVASTATGRNWKILNPDGIFNARWWGASPANADNYQILQDAIDAVSAQKGRLFVPKGRYEITLPLIMRDDVEFFGEKGTRLFNAGGNALASLQGIFFLGCHHPAQNDDYTYSAIQDFSEGATEITLNNAADASRFTVGKAIFIRTIDEFFSSPRFLPIKQVTARVSAINGAVISLERAVSLGMTGAQATDPEGAQTNIFGHVDSYILQKAHIHHIEVECPLGRWHMRTGTLDCHIHDIEIISSLSGIYGNSFYRTIFERINGVFHERALEFATGAGEVQVNDCFFQYVNNGANPAGERVWRVGEYAENVEFRNVRIIAGNYAGGGINLQGNNVRVINCSGEFSGISGTLLQFSSDTNNKKTYRRNQVIDCNFISRGTSLGSYVRFGGTGLQPEKCTLSGTSFSGAITGDAIFGEASDNRINGNVFERGGVNFSSSTFINNSITDNDFELEPSAGVSQDQNFYFGNRIESKTALQTAGGIDGYTPYTGGFTDLELLSVAPNGGSISVGDRVLIEIFGAVANGATGTHEIKLVDDQGEVFSIPFGAGETGDWSIEAMLLWISASGSLGSWRIRAFKGNTFYGETQRRTSLQQGAGTSNIRVLGTQSNASDSLQVIGAIAEYKIRGSVI